MKLKLNCALVFLGMTFLSTSSNLVGATPKKIERSTIAHEASQIGAKSSVFKSLMNVISDYDEYNSLSFEDDVNKKRIDLKMRQSWEEIWSACQSRPNRCAEIGVTRCNKNQFQAHLIIVNGWSQAEFNKNIERW